MRGAMRRLIAISVISASILVIACGGDDNNNKTDTRDDSSSGSASGGVVISGGRSFRVSGVEGSGALAGSSSLPGITVIGYGDSTAEPDAVLIRLTVGQGDLGGFSGDTLRLDLIEEEELQPVVEALKGQGIDEGSISVNTLTASPFGGFGASSAQISFRWDKPKELKAILDVAEDSIRQDTDQSLQNVEALFTVNECQPLEEQAWETALEDARARGQRLAELADLQLGDIIAISEAAGTESIYGLPSGCSAIEELPGFDFTPSGGGNSASEVEVDVSLQVTFALE